VAASGDGGDLWICGAAAAADWLGGVACRASVADSPVDAAACDGLCLSGLGDAVALGLAVNQAEAVGLEL